MIFQATGTDGSLPLEGPARLSGALRPADLAEARPAKNGAHIMPWFASKDDRLIMSVLEQWKEAFNEEVDTIGGWRGAEDRRPWQGWCVDKRHAPTERRTPPRLFSWTSILCGSITAHYPKLDPTPIMDAYQAVEKWYADRSAVRLPLSRNCGLC